MDSSLNVSNEPRKPEIPQYMEFKDFKTPGLQFDTDGYSNATLPQGLTYSPIDNFQPYLKNIRELTNNITDGEIDWSQKVKITTDVDYTRFDLVKLCKDITNKKGVFFVDKTGFNVDDRLFSLFENKDKDTMVYYKGQEVCCISDLEVINKIHSEDLDIPVLKSLKELVGKGISFVDTEKGNEITLYEIYKRIEKNSSNLETIVKIDKTRKEKVIDISDLLSLSYLYCSDKNKPNIKDLPEDKRLLLKSLVLSREIDMIFKNESKEDISFYGAHRLLSGTNIEKIFLSDYDCQNMEISSNAVFYDKLTNQSTLSKELLMDRYGLKNAKLINKDLTEKAADLIIEIVKKHSVKKSAKVLAELFKDCVKLTDYIPNKVLQEIDINNFENEIFEFFKLLVIFDKKEHGKYLSKARELVSTGKLEIINSLEIEKEAAKVLKALYDKSTLGKAFNMAGRVVGSLGGGFAGIAIGQTWGLSMSNIENAIYGAWAGGMVGGLYSFMGFEVVKPAFYRYCKDENRAKLLWELISKSFRTVITGSLSLAASCYMGGGHFSTIPNAFSLITSTTLGAVSGSYLGGLVGDKIGLEVYKLMNQKRAGL